MKKTNINNIYLFLIITISICLLFCLLFYLNNYNDNFQNITIKNINNGKDNGNSNDNNNEGSLLNKIFDEIYVINLKKDVEKRKDIEKKLNNLNIKYTIIEGVDGKKLKNHKLLDYGNMGAVGCRLSHLKVLKDAKKNNYTRILVFEDDIIFRKDFEKHLRKQYKTIENDNIEWKLLYLGCSYPYHGMPKKTKNKIMNSKDYVDTVNNTYGAFAVGIHKDIFDVIINKIKKTNKIYDRILVKYIHPKYKSIVFNPQIISAIVEKKSTTDGIFKSQKKYMSRNLININDFDI